MSIIWNSDSVSPLKPISKESEKASDPSFKDVYPQVVIVCILHSVFMQTGINVSYSATTLPQLLEEGSSLRVTEDQASWIASLVAIATLVGSLACGVPMDVYGRKATAIITCLPISLGWVLLAFTPNNVWIVYIARVLTGLGGGMTTVCLVYIGEICHQQFRPMLLSLNSAFVSLGIVVTNILGVYLHWRTVAFCSGMFSVATLLGIWLYCPESPQWIITYQPDNLSEAKKSLDRLYTNKAFAQTEYNRLLDSHQARQVNKQPSSNFLKEVFKGQNLIPLLVLTTIFLFQQLCGSYPIFFYAVNLFESIGTSVDKYEALILLGVARLIISFVTAMASKKIGRRPLMIASGIGMTVSSVVVAVFFSQRPYEGLFAHAGNQTDLTTVTNADPYSWVGAASILIYVSMTAFGFLIIPWSLIGELLPMSIRGNGSGFIICFTHIIMFGAVKYFPHFLDVFKISGAFYFFCFISVSGTVFVYYFLPETLGKSFDDIGKHFESLRKGRRTLAV
ncbi:facilitated trehalose transporter Tret1-like [Macrosteles quadrilineatus]|uniref:facilitated trehalose transporter Tret1-like n=1 Tax=Macrosteles quadrilineatus TaxID=74068 RepID=UPI0023E1B608|nr:facilitated trehalose transporter Tret1-like [Macrosteles quadrilineatus]